MHIATAFYQTPIVFGTQIFMIPAYLCVILVKLFVAIKLFMGPCCVYTSLVLFNIHAIYAWCASLPPSIPLPSFPPSIPPSLSPVTPDTMMACTQLTASPNHCRCRIFIKSFIYLKVFRENEYTIAIMFAGLICLPGVGAGVNMLAVVAIGIYIACAKKFLSDDAFYAQCSENHRNMFDNTMFNKGEAPCPFSVNSGDDDKVSHVDRHGGQHTHPNEQRMMMGKIFAELDTDNTGMLSVAEMRAAGSKYANSALLSILELLIEAKDEEDDGFSLEELCDLTINNLTDFDIFKAQAEAANTDREKCEVIFEAIDKNGNGKLDPLEMAVLFRQCKNYRDAP